MRLLRHNAGYLRRASSSFANYLPDCAVKQGRLQTAGVQIEGGSAQSAVISVIAFDGGRGSGSTNIALPCFHHAN